MDKKSLESSSGVRMNEPQSSATMAVGAALMTFVAVSCCAGIPAILSFVGTIGLGVLIKKHLLFPLMVGSLLLGSWGALRSYRTHQNGWFLAGYLSCALGIPLGMKLYHPLMYAGLAVLLILTGGELLQRRKKTQYCE
ncbi:MAG: MerC domain-containing protein [Leptospirillum sp.]